MKKLTVPKFANKGDEARWWDDHMRVVGENLMEAIKKQTVQRGTAQRLVAEARESKNITIRMPVADLERARRLSARKGLGYQTYMKMLLHEALAHEEAGIVSKPRRRP
jgi:predicted DNA binding CopG/RHH family protein